MKAQNWGSRTFADARHKRMKLSARRAASEHARKALVPGSLETQACAALTLSVATDRSFAVEAE